MDRRIAYKAKVVVEGVFSLVLLVVGGFVFFVSMLWTLFSFGYYRDEVEDYEEDVIKPKFRGRVVMSISKKIGDLRFTKVLVDGIQGEYKYTKSLFLIQSLEGNEVFMDLSHGDSLIKVANSDRVIIVRRNGEYKEGRLVKCIAEVRSEVFEIEEYLRY